MPAKKKQHFVPKFYLRNFSHNSSGKKLGIFNIPSFKFIPSDVGNLKNQAYKDYFYDHDPSVENAFDELEEFVAKIIQDILIQNSTPITGSKEHYALLTFIIFLSERTTYRVDELNESADKCIRAILSKDPSVSSYLDNKKFLMTEPTHVALRQAALYLPLTFDLYFKLIINKTEQPFITSDHPVVLYNQFLEPRKNYGGNTGLACKGLEIFLPLSPRHLLVFFDSNVYKLGNRKNLSIDVTINSDVRALNLLQCISANENLYFNEETSEPQIRSIVNQATRYRRKTRANVDEYVSTRAKEKMHYLLYYYLSDVKCSLSLSFVHIIKQAKHYNLGNGAVHVRNEQLCHLHDKFVKLVLEGNIRE
jgi:hypothetical protein